jgi:hypothetical protein
MYGTKAEFAALPCVGLIGDFFSGTKAFYGTSVGISSFNTRTNYFPAGISGTIVGDAGTFTISNAPDGPHDLLALRYSGNDKKSTTDKLIVRRAINPAHGSTIPVLDYNSTEAVTPASATYTINGVGSDPWSMTVSTVTGAQGTIWISSDTSTGGGNIAVPYQGWPASLQVAGDYNELMFESQSSFRGLAHNFANVSNRSITLGPTLSTPTITTLATSPATRLRAQLPSQSAYPSLFNLEVWQQGTGSSDCSICNAERAYDVIASAAYFGGTPVTWDLEMPDLSGASYLSTYGIQTGVALQWFVSAHSHYGLNQFVSLRTSLDETPDLFAWHDISPAVFSRSAPVLERLRLMRTGPPRHRR